MLAIWEKIKDDYQIIPKRTDAYLNWRFVAHPTNRYHRFLLEYGGEVKEYLVLGFITGRRGEKIGRIVDILASRKEEKLYGALLYFALKFFEKGQVATVQILESACPELKRALERNGFSHNLTKRATGISPTRTASPICSLFRCRG